MFSRIFPKQIDNNYRGHWLAIWLFALVVLLKATQGVESIVNTRSVVTTADGISLDGFSAAGADVVVALFALLGLYLLVIPLQSVVVLIRYRAMIPLMYVLIVVDYLGHRGIGWMKPIVRIGTPSGSFLNVALFALSVVGLALSLRGRD